MPSVVGTHSGARGQQPLSRRARPAFSFPMIIAWHSFIAPALSTAVLLAGARAYRTRSPRLAASLNATAFLVAFTALAAPLSYIAAMADLPLIDDTLARADHALGFDWQAWHDFIGDPLVLRIAYASFMPQCALVVLLVRHPGAYVRAVCLASLIAIAVSAILPAAGASTATEWYPVFAGLRDGSVRTLTGLGAQGIISFPSLHAALAVIVAIALWPTVARWPALALNALLLIATPTCGAHYLVDVLAGVVLGVLSVVACASHVGRTQAAHGPAFLASPHKTP